MRQSQNLALENAKCYHETTRRREREREREPEGSTVRMRWFATAVAGGEESEDRGMKQNDFDVSGVGNLSQSTLTQCLLFISKEPKKKKFTG